MTQALQKRERQKKALQTVTANLRQESPLQKRERQSKVLQTVKAKLAQETPLLTHERLLKALHTTRAKRGHELPAAKKTRISAVRVHMQKLRQKCKSSDPEEIIKSFENDVKDGPNYVCSACHRMMYRATVFELNEAKYTKGPSEMIDKVLFYRLKSQYEREWICKTCHLSLKRGKVPAQSWANNLFLAPQPKELRDLNALEVQFVRLLGQRIPFMKMIGLPRGRQHVIHGPAVNVLSNVHQASPALL
jgi:hypothetical protein